MGVIFVIFPSLLVEISLGCSWKSVGSTILPYMTFVLNDIWLALLHSGVKEVGNAGDLSPQMLCSGSVDFCLTVYMLYCMCL